MTDLNATERTHDLKIWPEFFDGVVSGRKTFEVRVNDRDYQNGDILHLMEFDPESEEFTGSECWMRVVFVCSLPYMDNIVGMSIEPLYGVDIGDGGPE